MIDYLVYISVKLFSKFLMFLPATIVSWLGRIMGNLGFYFDRRHRAVVYNNVKIAFGKTKDINQLNKLVKKTFQNFSQSFLELLRFPITDSKYIERFVEFDGREHVDEAMRKNSGLIMLGVHSGSWELGNAVCATLNYPYRIIIREQDRFTRLNNLLNSYRQIKGGMIIVRGSQTRDIVRSLKNNEILGLAVDQGGCDGMPIKFFGRNASMHTGALRLAIKFNTPVLVVSIIRKYGPYHKITFRPVDLKNTGNLDIDLKDNLESIIKLSERIIKEYPEQYLWFYKVWKYSNERRIVILNDGRVGHLRQSQAASKIIAGRLDNRQLISETKVIDIEFKNNFSRLLVNLYSLLFYRRNSYGSLRFLKSFLKEDSFNALSVAWSDYIISCGSSTAPVNLILSAETKARAIVIMRPGMLSFRRFNLAIVPKHDNPPKRENVVATKGALNLIDKKYLDEQSQSLLKRYKHLQLNTKKRIGFLIGGETKNYTLDIQAIGKMTEGIKGVSDRLDLEALWTTSGRTSKQVDDLLKDKLTDFPRCALLIIANENNIPEAVGGILGLSSIVVTSSDSISMISEAASSGKTVVVFRVGLKEGANSNSRHEKFLDNLDKAGHIILINPQQVPRTIEEVVRKNKTTKILKDNEFLKYPIDKIL